MKTELEELIEAYDGGIEELALLAVTCKHEGARVGAIKARMTLNREKFEILHAVAGYPPVDVIPQERDLAEVSKVIVEVLEENNIPDRVQEQIADRIARKEPPPA